MSFASQLGIFTEVNVRKTAEPSLTVIDHEQYWYSLGNAWLKLFHFLSAIYVGNLKNIKLL